MQDVLKSWAIPKGFPVESNERRTAFQTEDHPIDYLQFEGVIPPGQYGAGTVMVWDLGTYEVVDGNYWEGELLMFLSGARLKGEWSLERVASEDHKTKWLLWKSSHDAKPASPNHDDSSVLTGRTMSKLQVSCPRCRIRNQAGLLRAQRSRVRNPFQRRDSSAQ